MDERRRAALRERPHQDGVRDAAGNRFDMAPTDLKQGEWSPFEAKKVFDPAWHMAEIQRIAAARGGRVADGSEYRGAHAKMAFIGRAGNRFEASPNSAKRGAWSPFESSSHGAKVSFTPCRTARVVAMASGDTIVYRVLEDGSLRIRGHIAADGLSMRRWRWSEGVATIETVTGEMVRDAPASTAPTPR